MATASVVLAYVLLTTNGGDPLYWSAAEVAYSVNRSGTPDVLSSEFDAVDAGFGVWNQSSGVNYDARGCTSSGVGSILQGGDSVNDGRNVVTWMESGWPFGVGTIGITFTWFDPNSGVIGEADMLLNGDDYDWTTGSPHDTDVAAIVAHEAGHYLGLGHTNVTEATMYSTVEPGETKKRDLHPDDVDGAQYLYGSSSSGSPGVTGECSATAGDEEPGTGCGCDLGTGAGAGTGRGMLGALLAFAGLFGAWFLAQRRRMASVAIPAHGGSRRGARGALLAAAALVAVTSLSARDADATVMLDLGVRDLTAHSDVVVVGTVEEVETFTNGRTIRTRQRIVVSEVLAGTWNEPELEVWTPGGELPEGVEGPGGHRGLMIVGAPRFTAGDEVVVFGWNRPWDPPGVMNVTGLQQGKLLVARDPKTGVATLTRDLSGVVRVEKLEEGGLAPVTEDALDGTTLEALRLELRNLPLRGE